MVPPPFQFLVCELKMASPFSRLFLNAICFLFIFVLSWIKARRHLNPNPHFHPNKNGLRSWVCWSVKSNHCQTDASVIKELRSLGVKSLLVAVVLNGSSRYKSGKAATCVFMHSRDEWSFVKADTGGIKIGLSRGLKVPGQSTLLFGARRRRPSPGRSSGKGFMRGQIITAGKLDECSQTQGGERGCLFLLKYREACCIF